MFATKVKKNIAETLFHMEYTIAKGMTFDFWFNWEMAKFGGIRIDPRNRDDGRISRFNCIMQVMCVFEWPFETTLFLLIKGDRGERMKA